MAPGHRILSARSTASTVGFWPMHEGEDDRRSRSGSHGSEGFPTRSDARSAMGSDQVVARHHPHQEEAPRVRSHLAPERVGAAPSVRGTAAGVQPGTPSGIRTRDLHLERVTSWAARLWGQPPRNDTLHVESVSTSDDPPTPRRVEAPPRPPPPVRAHRAKQEGHTEP